MQKKNNLEGEPFLNSLILSSHHNENLQWLQVDQSLILKVNHYKFCVFLYFNFLHYGLLSLSKYIYIKKTEKLKIKNRFKINILF